MADTQQARFAFTLRDELGTLATHSVYVLLDPGTSVTTLLADLEGYAGLLVAVSGGAIVRQELVIIDTPTGRTMPVAGSRVEQNAVFNFLPLTSTRRYGQPVPALLDGKIVAGKVNLADADVSAYFNALLAGFGGGEYANFHFETLLGGALADAILSFRKHRRGLTRTSFEPGP